MNSDNSNWPTFLDLIESDPHRAAEELYRFVYQIFTTAPPKAARGLSEADRNDLMQEIVLYFINNSFKQLKKYQDMGRPFAVWFYTVCHCRIVDLKRKGLYQVRDHAQFEDDQGTSAVDRILGEYPDEDRKNLLLKVQSAMLELKADCQTLLKLAADEYKPQEMAEILGWGIDEAKKISDRLRYCRDKLKSVLALSGVNLGEIL